MESLVTARVSEGVARIIVDGEVDVSNADALRDALDAAFDDESVNDVIIDAAAMEYLDSTGIGVLVGASHKAADAGVGFQLKGAQDNVVRILKMLGLDEVIGLA